MRRLVLVVALTAAALLGASCPQGELLRRYATDLRDKKAESGHVSVNAFVTAIPLTPAEAGVAKLSDRGQEALVGVIGGMSKNSDGVYANLGKSLGGKSESAVIDHSRFKKRIVISALRDFDNMRNPADRIEELRTVIALVNPEEGTRFESWSRFSTEEESIDLGKLSLKKGSATKASISGAIPGTPATASLEQSFTREQAEELAVGMRRVKLAGALEPTSAVLYQQGVRNVDLTGTFALDVEVAIANTDVGNEVMQFNGFKKDGVWLDPNSLEFSEMRLRIPNTCGGDLDFTLAARYRVRVVERNDKTYAEGDDKVKFVDGATRGGPYTLVSAKELEVLIWRIVDAGDLALGLENVGELAFQSFGEAVDLLEYLAAKKPKTLRGRRLIFFDRPLDYAKLRDLSVESYQVNECARAATSPEPVAALVPTSADALLALVAEEPTPLAKVPAEDLKAFARSLRFKDGRFCGARYDMLERHLNAGELAEVWKLLGPAAVNAEPDSYCPRIGYGCKVQTSSLCNVAYCGGPVP